MGIVNADINFAETVATQIRQMGVKAAKHGIEFMRVAGDEIVALAKDYAPKDEGDLERAIERNPAEERDDLNRKAVEVWVNPDMPGSGGMKVGDYAYLMHEGLTPYGDGTYRPREGTINKGPQAGGKFLERAVNEISPGLTDKISDLLRRQGIQ